MAKLYAIADEPFHSCIKLTKGKQYEVISYLQHQGDNLFLVCNDEGESTTYNVAHFTSVTLKG